MKTVKISYNPYKMKTTMHIDGIDVCKNANYTKFKKFIEQGTPLQTWIEPIPYLDWDGFVNELSESDRNDEVTVEFSGREIDLMDMQRSIEYQNARRADRARVKYNFTHQKILDDKALSNNIDSLVKDIKSDRFRALVQVRTGKKLTEKYNALEKNYAVARESEFYIVFAGVYSSGKSTILNTIIRHNILPTSAKTCTSKNCRIKHDGELGGKVSLSCFNAKGEQVGKTHIFENDADCAALFEEICPMNDTNEKYASVETMEIGVDLSHLYPDSVSKDKFTIVLIDTPGMDSAQSSEDGKNIHAEVALEAISMESKPMIILCADANKYEDKSIGEFMREIIAQAKEDGGGFNDRFLFLMNKSDTMSYKANETAEDAKAEFAAYLTDSSKWNIEGGDRELKTVAENASHFVPRVFMTASLMAWAVQNGVDSYTREELREDSFKRQTKKDFDGFVNNVSVYEDENYLLANHCDIPDYRKEEVNAEFKVALEDGDDIRAAELQCGLVSVELAIRDYVERYAYPVKVRGLMDTFEDILYDVNGFMKGTLAELQRIRALLGENYGGIGGAQGSIDAASKKIEALVKAKAKANEQLLSLDKIVFDSLKLHSAISDFTADIDEDECVCFVRKNKIVKTGQKSRYEVLKEIESKSNQIKNVFETALRKTNNVLSEIKERHDKQLLEIFKTLKNIVKDIEELDVFKHGEYNFTDSVLWKSEFEDIDSERFAESLKKKVVDKSTKQERQKNATKEEWSKLSGWHFIKRYKAKKMDDYVYVSRTVDGYYETAELVKSIDECLQDMTIQGESMKSAFEKSLDNSKNKVKEMVNRLIDEAERFLEDIKNAQNKIDSLSSDINALIEEINSCEKTVEWLNGLIKRIRGI